MESAEKLETPEQLAVGLTKDLSEYKKELKGDVKSLVDTVDELKKVNDSQIESIKKQGQEITILKELNSNKNVRYSFDNDLEKQIKEHSEWFKKAHRGERVNGSLRITAKVAGTIQTDTNITGDIPLPSIEVGIERVVRRQPFILGLTNGGGSGRIAGNEWGFNEQKNPDGGAGMTAEGTLKSQADFDLVQTRLPVQKVTSFIKVSTEMLDDVPLFINEVRQEIIDLITLEIDSQILNGDGTGLNLTGILVNATAFSVAGTDFALGVINPNNQDVLEAAITQVRVAQFEPSFILMNPTDLGYMKVGKDTTGAYEINPIVSNGNTIIDGVPVIANTGVIAGDFLVGDFSKSSVVFKKELALDMAQELDDFTKNRITVLGESRMVHRVKTNNFPAFVTGNFGAAKIVMLKP